MLMLTCGGIPPGLRTALTCVHISSLCIPQTKPSPRRVHNRPIVDRGVSSHAVRVPCPTHARFARRDLKAQRLRRAVHGERVHSLSLLQSFELLTYGKVVSYGICFLS